MHSDPDYSLNHIAKFYKKEYRKSFERVDSINVYGPNQNPNSPYSGVISILVDR
ncbi:hypothetical protein EfmJHP10_08960 [Enterococcus faecium]|nr:hypothetical protein EfmJHP10_08960 [Enterococcus faecium]